MVDGRMSTSVDCCADSARGICANFLFLIENGPYNVDDYVDVDDE